MIVLDYRDVNCRLLSYLVRFGKLVVTLLIRVLVLDVRVVVLVILYMVHNPIKQRSALLHVNLPIIVFHTYNHYELLKI